MKKEWCGSVLFCSLMRSLPTTIGDLCTRQYGGNWRWFYVDKFKSRRIITVMVWGYGHTTAITGESAWKLVLTHCAELCSALIDIISWYVFLQATSYLVFFPLIIGKHVKSVRPFSVCVVEKEKLDYSQNVRCFNSGFSQAALSHIPLLVIF